MNLTKQKWEEIRVIWLQIAIIILSFCELQLCPRRVLCTHKVFRVLIDTWALSFFHITGERRLGWANETLLSSTFPIIAHSLSQKHSSSLGSGATCTLLSLAIILLSRQTATSPRKLGLEAVWSYLGDQGNYRHRRLLWTVNRFCATLFRKIFKGAHIVRV